MLRIYSEHYAGRLFELVYVDSIHLADFFLLSIDLLDHIKAGLFDLVCLAPLQQQHGPEFQSLHGVTTMSGSSFLLPAWTMH